MKGGFEQKKSTASFSAPHMPSNKKIETEKVKRLILDLEKVIRYWEDNRNEIIEGVLVQIEYSEVIAKSNRIKSLFSGKGKDDESVVGARFAADGAAHIITHFIPLERLELAQKRLILLNKIINDEFSGLVTDEKVKTKCEDKKTVTKIEGYGISKKLFLQLLVDICRVKKISVLDTVEDGEEEKIISIYKNVARIKIAQTVSIILFFYAVCSIHIL